MPPWSVSERMVEPSDMNTPCGWAKHTFSCHGTMLAGSEQPTWDENMSLYMSVSTEVAGGFEPRMRSMDESWKTRICAAIGKRPVTARVMPMTDLASQADSGPTFGAVPCVSSGEK